MKYEISGVRYNLLRVPGNTYGYSEQELNKSTFTKITLDVDSVIVIMQRLREIGVSIQGLLFSAMSDAELGEVLIQHDLNHDLSILQDKKRRHYQLTAKELELIGRNVRKLYNRTRKYDINTASIKCSEGFRMFCAEKAQELPNFLVRTMYHQNLWTVNMITEAISNMNESHIVALIAKGEDFKIPLENLTNYEWYVKGSVSSGTLVKITELSNNLRRTCGYLRFLNQVSTHSIYMTRVIGGKEVTIKALIPPEYLLQVISYFPTPSELSSYIDILETYGQTFSSIEGMSDPRRCIESIINSLENISSAVQDVLKTVRASDANISAATYGFVNQAHTVDKTGKSLQWLRERKYLQPNVSRLLNSFDEEPLEQFLRTWGEPSSSAHLRRPNVKGLTKRSALYGCCGNF